MVPSEETNKATRREWRDLGFFYDRDDELREWQFVGSRDGLLRFPSLLKEYVADSRNQLKSEHEHYGPYMYLKIVTWEQAGISEDSIHGTLADIERLAEILKSHLSSAKVGDRIAIRDEYCPHAEYSMSFEVCEDSFDPSSRDGSLAA